MGQQDIDKKMSTLLNPKDELKYALEPFNEMGSQLGMAPLAIGVLGHLCLISTKGDFDLRCNASSEFKLLTFPDSFRACLCQVAGAGYDAFLKADSAMESIRLRTGRVPNLLKTTLKLLYHPQATPEDLAALLPINLNEIKVVAEECITEASSVEVEFRNIIHLLTELQAATLRKQGKVQEAKNLTENRIRCEKMQQEQLKVQEKNAKTELDSLKKECAEYTKRFQDSLDNMPGLGKMFLASIGDGIRNLLSSVTFSSTRNIAGSLIPKSNSTTEQQSNGKVENNVQNLSSLLGKNTKVSAEELRRYMFEVATIEKIIKLVDCTIQASNQNSNNALDKQQLQPIKYELDYLITCLRNKRGAEVFRKSMLAKMEELLSLLKSLEENRNDKSSVKRILSSIQNLLQKISNIILCIHSICNVPHFSQNGPRFENRGASSSITANLSAQALKKVEMTKMAMDTVRRQADEANKRRNQLLDDINSSILQLEKLRFDQMQQTNILEVISKGLEAFAKLRDQWTELIQFFKSISEFIKCSMSKELNLFADSANAAHQNQLKSTLSKEMIYQAAYQSVKVASIVFHLSDTYCGISKQHLIPLNNNLFHLLALDSVRDAQKIKLMEESLRRDTLQVNAEIKRFVNAKHREYIASSNLREQNMLKELENLTPVSMKEKEEASADVKKMYKSVVEASSLTEEELDSFC